MTLEKDDKIIIAKVLDDKDKADRENRIVTTDFLDMRMQGIAETEIKFSGSRYFFDGGYEGAERRFLVFLPDWAEPENYYEDRPIEVLRVSHKTGGRELTHRDYLGSLLGLGISRGKIGDIIVCEKGADIIIQKEMEEFLLANYFKAGRTELSMEIKPMEELNLSELRTELVTDTVASLRLDAVLASAYHCARSKAVEAINGGLVFVNNAQVLKPDFALDEGSIIVLRGKGKCVLKEIGGTSRKDRTFITIEKYI